MQAKMGRMGRIIAGLALALALGAPQAAQAAGFVPGAGLNLAKGRAAAIKTQLANHYNQQNNMHVGNQLTKKNFTIRTKKVNAMRPGSVERKVKFWINTSNQDRVLGGKAKAFTPVVPDGGKDTRVTDITTTVAPRSLVPPPSMQ